MTLSTDHDKESALVVRCSGSVEEERLLAVFEHHFIVGLGCAELMIVHAMVLIGIREFLSGFGTVVGAVVEAIAIPGCAGEFSPFDMVGQKFAGSGVEHEDFGPVAAGARYGVCGVFTVAALVNACESHSAVVGQSIGVDENFRNGTDGVHAVKHALVAGAIVLVKVVLTIVFFRREAAALVIVELFEASTDILAERNITEIILCEFILCLHPFESLGGGVVLERTVCVDHLHTESLVDSAVGGGCRILQRSLLTAGCEDKSHCTKLVGFHICDI